MNIYGPIFSSARAAAAAGMTPANFRAHLSRGNFRIIGGKGAVEAATAGKGHLFTIYDVMLYAMANCLIQFGVDPKLAFEVAIDFAFAGDDEREPGGVLDTAKYGWTLFAYTPGLPIGHCFGSKALESDPLMLLRTPGFNRASGAIVINVNDLRNGVFHSLGLKAGDYA